MVRKQEQQMQESGRGPSGPVQEEIITSRKVTIEESSAPMFNSMGEANPGTNVENSPVRTPNGYANHGTQYSPQVTPQNQHRTVQPYKAQSMPNSPTRFAPNGGPPPNVYQPQPVRVKKEKIRYITRVTPPGTPIGEHRGFEEQLQKQQQGVEMQTPVQPYRRGSAPGASTTDDSMSWLQKQQQKLREKKAKEGKGRPSGDLVRPSPWREQPEPKITENIHTYAARQQQSPPIREPQTYASREPQTYAAKEPQTYSTVRTYREQTYTTSQEPQRYASREPQQYAAKEPQTYAPREQPSSQPNGNLSWLEMQQQKLRERQDGMQKPLYVDTSHHTTSSQISPLRSDSGLSSPASQYKPSSISPGNSTSSSIRYGRPTSPIHQIEDLEKSISELESLKNPPRAGAPTPPNTYVNYQTTTETRTWQSHQRPLNRQVSDTSHDREYIPMYKRQPEEHQAPSYGGSPSVSAGLPPPSPRKDRPASPG